jgi:hypothetical protein
MNINKRNSKGTLASALAIALVVSAVAIIMHNAAGPDAPDFTVSASPTLLTINQGASGTSTVNITSTGGFNATVNLSISGALSGINTTLSPASVTPPSNGSVTSTLTVNVNQSAVLGTHLLEINATSGALTHIANVSLTVLAAPDFSLSASPSQLALVQGTSGQSNITVTSMNGFNASVSLSASDLPTGVTGAFNTASITPPVNGSANSAFSINVTASTAPGNYSLIINGTSGTLSHTVSINLTVLPVPDFSISASPDSLIIIQGSSNTSTITVMSLKGFDKPVNLSVSGLSTGVNATLNLTTVTPPSGGLGISILTISISNQATPGNLTLTVTGTSGSLNHSAMINLTINEKPAIEVHFRVHPESLNVKSNGRWVTALIELPEGFNAQDINISTIMLNETIPAELRPIEIGGQQLMVKFDRAMLEQYILGSGNPAEKFTMVSLTVTGRFNDGTRFVGTDTIKAIMSSMSNIMS